MSEQEEWAGVPAHEWGPRGEKLSELQAAMLGVTEDGVVGTLEERLAREAALWKKLKWLREKPDGVDSEEVLREAKKWVRSLMEVMG